MCVSAGRAALFSRAAFGGVIAAAAAPFVLGSGAVAEAADVDRFPLPPAPAGLSPGNARAAQLAAASPFVRSTYAHAAALAASIEDGALRSSVTALLHGARPLYAARTPSADGRARILARLQAAGFAAPELGVASIFPPGTEAGGAVGIQPFWSTPGSGENSHHAYPGGLAVHEYFNATMSASFAQNYDRLYFGGRPTVERDTVVAAALYHDIMKTVVFQWHPDGTLFDEATIAQTGAHHILSGAEAIARGRSPHFVTTLLSAHAAPSLGDEQHVVDWCRTAAIVADVDPVAFGLLAPDGAGWRLAADPPPLEAFISNLSDHDYVVTVEAMHVVNPHLRAYYTRAHPTGTAYPWYRAAILCRTSILALYDTLARRGEEAFLTAVRRAEPSGPV